MSPASSFILLAQTSHMNVQIIMIGCANTLMSKFKTKLWCILRHKINKIDDVNRTKLIKKKYQRSEKMNQGNYRLVQGEKGQVANAACLLWPDVNEQL